MIRHIFLLLLPLPALAQGPLDGYLKGKGALDLAPSFSFNRADRFEGAPGQIYPFPFRGNALSLFTEYGLTSKVDLVATAAYVFTSTRSGLQDGAILAKYRPLQRPLAGGKFGLLLGAGAAFPLSNYQPTDNGALGQKAVILPVRLMAQWESPIGLFVHLAAGHQFRLDQPSGADIERIRKQRPGYQPTRPASFSNALLKIGFPAARYYLDAWLEGQWTPGGADFKPGQPDLPQTYGVSYLQIGGTALYSENPRTGFFVSGGYILKGRNTGRLLRLSVGMVFKRMPKLSYNTVAPRQFVTRPASTCQNDLEKGTGMAFDHNRSPQPVA